MVTAIAFPELYLALSQKVVDGEENPIAVIYFNKIAEVQKRWPDEMREWLASASVAPPGGESFKAVSKRVRGVLATIKESSTAAVKTVDTFAKMICR